MTERPILFSTPMVQAIQEGRKTQTRRGVKNITEDDRLTLARSYGFEFNNDGFLLCLVAGDHGFQETKLKCPYGQVGDVLWVRETWTSDRIRLIKQEPYQTAYFYKANEVDKDYVESEGQKWKPSIFMPKQACRIRLKITDIIVECLQDISEDDAIAEGVERNCLSYAKRDCGRADCVVLGCQDKDFYHYTHDLDDFPAFSAVESFESLWQSINGPESWNLNPWVWVITFEKL